MNVIATQTMVLFDRSFFPISLVDHAKLSDNGNKHYCLCEWHEFDIRVWRSFVCPNLTHRSGLAQISSTTLCTRTRKRKYKQIDS